METSKKPISAKVKSHNEVCCDRLFDGHDGQPGWKLCFQKCTYIYSDGQRQDGYRFIWRRPNERLQAGRAQARIPTLAQLTELTEKATRAGWLR